MHIITLIIYTCLYYCLRVLYCTYCSYNYNINCHPYR
nr:MAG TPA: Malignant T-cell-amplified sequence 1, Density-regulated initiation, Ribosome, TRANSLATION [Crassvirales sp.]